MSHITETLTRQDDPRGDQTPKHSRPSGPASGMWCRGRIIATCAVACTLVILLHGMIPNSFGNLGSLVESFLPWASVSIPLLLVLALIRRSALALITVLLPAFAYLSLFGGTLVDKRGDGGNLTVVTHNVNDRNPDPTGTARSLASSGADVIALQKLTAVTTPIYEKALDSTYTHHSVQGTVGLWSKYPSTAHARSRSCRGPGPCAAPSTPSRTGRGLRRPPAVRTRAPLHRLRRKRARQIRAPARRCAARGPREQDHPRRRLQRHSRRQRPAVRHRRDALDTADSRRRLRPDLARIVPSGPDRSDFRERC